jgi:putative PIN family toxin of toxin-antitoxin system
MDAPPSRLLDAWRQGAFELIISRQIRDEFERTLTKPYFRARLTDNAILRAVYLLDAYASTEEVKIEVRGVATHPEDDFILALAVSSRADYLVTGDSKLRALAALDEVAIRSPAEFLSDLEAQGLGGGPGL